jgi:AAA15 family ATPase/GTPase
LNIILADFRQKNINFNFLPKIASTKEVYDSRIYIPEKEMLSNSTGLLALYNKRAIPFEKTYIDIVENAEFPETKETSSLCQKLLNKIGEIIDGEVVYEQDTFYIKKKNEEKIHFSWEASGFRKFGLPWKLLRNGLLEKESLLFWDEPENSLNPELIPVLVDILLELTRNSVQVFLATHSELVSRKKVRRFYREKIQNWCSWKRKRHYRILKIHHYPEI